MRSRSKADRSSIGGLPSMSPRQTAAYLQAREWIRRARRAAASGGTRPSRSGAGFEMRGDTGRPH